MKRFKVKGGWLLTINFLGDVSQGCWTNAPHRSFAALRMTAFRLSSSAQRRIYCRCMGNHQRGEELSLLMTYSLYALGTLEEVVDDCAEQRDEENDQCPGQFVVALRWLV